MARPRNNFTCSVEGCGNPAHAKGWCRQHWTRMHLYGRLEKIQGIEKGNCKVEGCENPIKGNGLCNKHYQLNRKYGRTHLIKKESKTLHPFYHLWFERKQNKDLEFVWLDFWTFVKDISPKPEGHYFLTKLTDAVYGPLNFKWTEKLKQEIIETDSEWWARKWEDRRVRNPDEEYERNLIRNYGMTLAEYTKMLEEQNFVCAICDEPETYIMSGRVKRLAVDHDHKTGKIRKLLCHRCNKVLGSVNENTDILDTMISYIEHHKEQELPQWPT